MAEPKPSTSSMPPPDVPLDQTVAPFNFEGRGPLSQKRKEAWDFRLILFLGGYRRRKVRQYG